MCYFVLQLKTLIEKKKKGNVAASLSCLSEKAQEHVTLPHVAFSLHLQVFTCTQAASMSS